MITTLTCHISSVLKSKLCVYTYKKFLVVTAEQKYGTFSSMHRSARSVVLFVLKLVTASSGVSRKGSSKSMPFKIMGGRIK